MSAMGLLAIAGAVVFVPLTIGHIHDCIGLKQNEAELHKLDVIDKIESKYGIEITDEKLTMRGDR